MEFRSLRLVGFKSFADPTDLTLSPGLTGIVGPNGCGKSNLTEGLRWAMGEGSSRGLRAEGMDEIIFAGARGRPARAFAEVTLGLWSDGDEIAVTRRILRGEGSQYRMNGGPARARDVQLLFADAATGAHAAALVGQGRVAAVISAKPAERRQMLEEAAGIAGLAARRKEAEQRLRATAANLDRVGVVAAEIDARVAGLKRQARAAERYADLSAMVRTAEARLLHAAYAQASARAAAAAGQAAAGDAAVAGAADAVRSADAQRAAASDTVARARAAEVSARAEADRLARLADTRLQSRARAGQQLAELRARAAALDRDLARAADDCDEAATLALRASTGVNRLAEGDAERAAAAVRASVKLEEAGAALVAAEAALGMAVERRAEATAGRRAASEALNGARTRHERLTTELEAAGRALAALGPDVDGAADLRTTATVATAIKAERDGGLATLEAAAGQADAALALAIARADEARAVRDREEAARAELAPRLAAARATLAALLAEQAALRRSAGQDGGVQSRGNAGSGVEVRPGYEAALTAALGHDLAAAFGVVGEGWAAVRHGYGDPALPDGATPLTAHVKAPRELARRLAQIGVVDDNALGIAIAPLLAPGQRLVSRRGALWRWDGFELARAGDGSAADRLRAANRLAAIDEALTLVTQEADAAAARAGGAEAACAEAVNSARTAAAALAIAERTRSEAHACLARGRADVATRAAQVEAEAKIAAQRAAAAIDRARAAASDKAARRGVIVATIARLGDARAAAANDMRAAETRMAQLPPEDVVEAALAAARAAAEAARMVRDRSTGRAADTRAAIADAARARGAAERDAVEWERRAGQARARYGEIAGRSSEAAPALIAAEADLADHTVDTIARAATAREEAVSLADCAERERAGAEHALGIAEMHLAAATEARAAAREARAAAAVDAGHAAEARAEIARATLDRFGCEPALLPGRFDFPPDAAPLAECDADLDRLKRERERLGPVNLRAVNELEEADARAITLADERAEVETACNRLRGSIGALNRDGRARLTETFDKVAGRFATLFQTLFGGGEARLALVDADDPLDAGLEIFAKPPGKAAQSLALLSGGEQALTAVALLFAFFLENPAPICVLDEVDAPLDDANVERFCDLLREVAISSPTRFLVVTHNPVTMASMDRLYGVTMAEPGVSQMVSVDLAAAEALLVA